MRDEGKIEGPLSMSESDLAALEERVTRLKASGKLLWSHVTNCEHSDAETINALTELLCYIGISDEVCVVKLGQFKQPAGEMAVHNEE